MANLTATILFVFVLAPAHMDGSLPNGVILRLSRTFSI
jgi:hypothetical protein